MKYFVLKKTYEREEMMKILVVSNMYPSKDYPSFGVFVKNFVDICEEKNINVEKIVMYKTTGLLAKGFRYLIYFTKIILAVLFRNYDVVYVHYAGQNSIPFYFLTILKKMNLIFNLHGSDVVAEKTVHKMLRVLTRKIVKRCNKVVVPSKYFKYVVSEKLKVDPQKIYVFPSSGINEDIFYQKSKDIARKNVGLEDSKKIIGYVGRIEFGKGWNILLESIKILNDKRIINPIEYQFVFVGDGKQSNEFSDMVNELSINHYIVKIPLVPQDSLIDFYNSFDIFCFPTMFSESLGLVGIEALACGTPVIASDFAAPKYYIENGYNGFKFEVESPTALAECIETYINLSNKEKQKMSNNCIESAKPYGRKAVSSILINNILKA